MTSEFGLWKCARDIVVLILVVNLFHSRIYVKSNMSVLKVLHQSGLAQDRHRKNEAVFFILDVFNIVYSTNVPRLFLIYISGVTTPS